MLLALLNWVITLATVVLFAGKYWWFPEAINEHAREYDEHFRNTLYITGVIFFLAQMSLGWVIFKYRSNGGRSSYVEGNNTMEVVWTTGAAVLFIGAVLMSTQVWAGVHLSETPANAVTIELMAKQFAFSFRYAGADGKFGKTDIKQISDANGNPFGVDEKDPAGKDDVTSSAIRVPAGRPVLLKMRSRDVIHNFFVRELRVKQDVVPGMEIPLRFQADKPGTYEVPCSELCGLGHHQMRSTLIVLPPADFENWLKEEDQKLKQQ
ncbi:MAG: cytochrome c oxidase subunit II [Acidobacteriia bacterium]|nr:cytochrome c oxidase subunit II [Terriglobia bacterium]